MSTTRTLLPGCIALLLVVIPLLLSPFRSREVRTYVERVERREQTPFPRFSAIADVLDDTLWAEFSDALEDRLALRDVLIPLKRRIEYEVLKAHTLGDVVTGRDGWLFLGNSLSPPGLGPEEALRDAKAARRALEAFVERSRSHRARLGILIAPDKAAIYGDMLSDRARSRVDAYRESRQFLAQAFAGDGAPELIDMWSLYRGARDRASELVYDRHGTHHTDSASLLMAKAIVEFVQPGSWNRSFASDAKGTREGRRVGELARKAGLMHLTEPFRLLSAERRGVAVDSALLDGVPATTDELSAPHSWARPLVVEMSSSGPPLIEGEALVVHDSFIGTSLRKRLFGHFARISFIHREKVSSCELQRALDEYDVVIIETVERSAVHTFNRLFEACPAALARATPSIGSRLDPARAPVLARAADGSLRLATRGGGLLREATGSRAGGLRGGVGSIARRNGEWRAVGWVVDVREQRRPDRILAFRGRDLTFLPAELTWMPHPALARDERLGEVRSQDLRFFLRIDGDEDLEEGGVLLLAVYPDCVQAIKLGPAVPAALRPRGG